jgi:hypothetical protein
VLICSRDMSSPNDNTSPHARAYYDNPVARRRQLSSGPLAGIIGKEFHNYVSSILDIPNRVLFVEL